MTTGERMKCRRKELNIPVEQVANALRVSVATIYRYENGEIEKVPGTILESLAKVLCTTPAYLMGWAEEENAILKNPQTVHSNLIKIAGRDGSLVERELSDDQMNLLKKMLEQMPQVENHQL